jgi:hypothetical protein
MKHFSFSRFIILAIITLLAGSAPSRAQQFKASIKDLAFMAGTWTQKHKWGDMEEFWGPPMGNNMICSYRCVSKGKVVFYEFVVIEQTGDVPVMKLRHFNPGSIGWEEKDKPRSYALVQLTKNKAVFEAPDKSLSLTYIRTGTRTMDIILNEKNKKGDWEKEVFNYTLR